MVAAAKSPAATPDQHRQVSRTEMAVSLELVKLLVDGARFGDMEDVVSALTQGVAIDTPDTAGRTALHMASANGHASACTFLLSKGAMPDIKNQEGNTPLHWACLNGHLEVAQLLLDAGASATILNNANNTPYDEALTRNFQNILDLIKSRTEDQLTPVEEDVLQNPDDALDISGENGTTDTNN